MGHAPAVPQTFELTGDHARATLLGCGRRHLVADAFSRFRTADGFSHARASAFVLSLLLVEAVIAVVGLASATGSSAFGRTVIDIVEGAVPGPAGRILTGAVRQAQEAGGKGQYLALGIGLLATLITATTAFGQFERSCNRIYGVEQDRPSTQKYLRAFMLAVTAGIALTVAVTSLVLGRPIDNAIEDGWAEPIWDVTRWPIAILLLIGATTFVMKWSPNRRQPGYSWLGYGAAISVALTVAASLLLALFFGVSTTFGDTYGPLAGLVALLLWTLMVAIASLYGVAVTAQLEMERAESGAC